MAKAYGNIALGENVAQPGDPLVSPDGNTTVSANNDGTASITRPVTGGGTETKTLAMADQIPSVDAVLSSSSTNPVQNAAIYEALSNTNTNFTRIRNWLTNTNFSYNPTITFNSGWSASTVISITIINGRIGVVGGNLKCTSALAAGTSYAPFSKLTHPSGISISSGNGVPATNRCWIYFNNASTAIIPEATVNANTNIYFRGVVPLEINPITATSYVQSLLQIV